MKNSKKSNLAKYGATPLRNFDPFDHNEPGTPVAVKMTATPLPFAPVSRKTKGNTATTEYGRDSGDGKNMKAPRNKKTQNSGKVNPSTSKAACKSNLQSPKFDPNGSYTGAPARKNERPVQDADDL